MTDSQDINDNGTPYYAPDWCKGMLWYQIFPERFRNGDPSNDPTAERVGGPPDWRISPWTGDWYARAPWEQELGPDFRDGVFYRRYGGDLQGIIDKLDYLQELGVGGLYLNPVFDAVSLHKYDTSFYHHIDRFFGPDPEGDAAIMEAEDPADPATWRWTSADKLFLELVRKVHERGMKIIIDGVFNHTGTDFWAFRDLEQRQQQSDFAEWYSVISWQNPHARVPSEFDYDSWWGVKDLPELKEKDGTLVKPVRDHIAAITRRWMDPDGDGDPGDGVDGWRLDVPEEIGTAFWEEWCGLVREINPEAYISGEVWTDKASEYIRGGLFTAVMNYRFAETVQDFMIDKEITVTEFDELLENIRHSFPSAANHAVQNLMDSHDTPRLASMIINPGREYDKEGTPEEGFDVRKPDAEERRLQRLIALFQYAYIGAPMIYYGTEAGMWGADDPDDRKPMLWPDMEYEPEATHPMGEEREADENAFDEELFDWYKKLGGIRARNEVLQRGGFKSLLTDDGKGVYAFARFLKGEKPYVAVLNCSGEHRRAAIPLSHFGVKNGTFTDLISEQTFEAEGGTVTVDIDRISGMILKP